MIDFKPLDAADQINRCGLVRQTLARLSLQVCEFFLRGLAFGFARFKTLARGQQQQEIRENNSQNRRTAHTERHDFRRVNHSGFDFAPGLNQARRLDFAFGFNRRDFGFYVFGFAHCNVSR